MTPGARVDYELHKINEVAGRLVLMVIKKKLWRSTLEAVADQLESSAKEIRKILSETDTRRDE